MPVYGPLLGGGSMRAEGSIPILGSVTQFSRPATSAFTWLNQSSASVTENVNGGPSTIQLTTGAPTTANLIGRIMPIAGLTPWTYTAVVTAHMLSGTAASMGLMLYDSGGGKAVLVGNRSAVGSIISTTVVRYTTVTTTSTATGATPINGNLEFVWARITNDGTNLKYYTSVDGITWGLLLSETLTNYLAAITHVGFGFDAIDTPVSGFLSHVNLWHLVQS